MLKQYQIDRSMHEDDLYVLRELINQPVWIPYQALLNNMDLNRHTSGIELASSLDGGEHDLDNCTDAMPICGGVAHSVLLGLVNMSCRHA